MHPAMDKLCFLLIERVLAIKDNRDNLKLINSVQNRRGYDVAFAETGEEGVEMAGDRERTLATGCDGFCEKPINLLTIMDAIHQAIGGNG